MDRAFSSRFRLLLFDISNEAPCADEVLRTIPLPYAPFHALFILVEISRLPAKWMREMKQFDYNLCISLLVADTPFPLSGVVSSSPLALLNSLRRRWRERCQIDCQTILQNKCRNRNRYCMVWVTRKKQFVRFSNIPMHWDGPIMSHERLRLDQRHGRWVIGDGAHPLPFEEGL